MTKLQLDYWNLRWRVKYESISLELERKKQEETARHNIAQEEETVRSNKAKERETRRHNIQTEYIDVKSLEKEWAKLSEQQRANNLNYLLNYAEYQRKRDEFVANHKIAKQEFALSVKEEAHDYELGNKKLEIETFRNGFFNGLATKFGIWLENEGILGNVSTTVKEVFEEYAPKIESKTNELIETKLKPFNDKLEKLNEGREPVKRDTKPRSSDGNSRKDEYVMNFSSTQEKEFDSNTKRSGSNVIYSPGTYGPGIVAPGSAKQSGNQAPVSRESTGPSSGSSVIYSKGTKPSNYGPGIK